LAFNQGIRAQVRVCDFKQNHAATALVADIEAELGPIDVLVNNAGVIQVGPTASVTLEDFEETMQTVCRQRFTLLKRLYKQVCNP